MKVSIYMAVSANGLISNHRNVPDWLSWEYGEGFMEMCHRTKAVIMGRKTYDILAPDHLPLQSDGTTVVMTSQTSMEPANPTVLFTKDSPDDIVNLLAERNYDEAVIIGGGEAVTAFLNAGLVEDIYFVVEPVLFGGGLPFFDNPELEVGLHLVDVEKVNENTIRSHYKVATP